LVTAPATCPYKQGVTLAINAGSITCSQAVEVAAHSGGPNSSTAPAGWTCNAFPETVGGKQLTAADGKGCQRRGVKLSVYAAGAGGLGEGNGEGSVAPQGSGAFASPSGNIVCSNDSKALECALGGAPPAYRLTPTGSASRAGTLANPDVEPSPLAYGHGTTVLGIPCKSEEAGVTCRNRAGHGFFLSRQTQSLF
jgi:hypothetical protein